MKQEKTSRAANLLVGVFAATVTTCSVLSGGNAFAESPLKSAEEQAKLYPVTTEYRIERNGKPVGTHTLAFSNSSDGLRVRVESNITVTVLKVPVFRFNYTADEQWTDGTLQSVNARTNRAGDITTATLEPDTAETVRHSSNHWNAAVLDASEVFNTLTGETSEVAIETLGVESLTDDTDTVAATRYRYTGDIQADVWYDDQNRWVKLQFKGDDGSDITYTANPVNLMP